MKFIAVLLILLTLNGCVSRQAIEQRQARLEQTKSIFYGCVDSQLPFFDDGISGVEEVARVIGIQCHQSGQAMINANIAANPHLSRERLGALSTAFTIQGIQKRVLIYRTSKAKLQGTE